MTARKELFIRIKEQLESIAGIDLVDLWRNQIADPGKFYPDLFTAAFIKVARIDWATMVEQRQEGRANVEIFFVCKDGWLEHFVSTDGLDEIDVTDSINEKIHLLSGDYFTPLELAAEDIQEEDQQQMVYVMTFTTTLYRYVNRKYEYKKINVT